MRETTIESRPEAEAQATLTFSKSFRVVPDVTPRTAQVADAFGVGVDDEQVNVLYDETPIT
ncbi:hypothetical protein LCGC14_2858310, partial [marine sediment metagenome]